MSQNHPRTREQPQQQDAQPTVTHAVYRWATPILLAIIGWLAGNKLNTMDAKLDSALTTLYSLQSLVAVLETKQTEDEGTLAGHEQRITSFLEQYPLDRERRRIK